MWTKEGKNMIFGLKSLGKIHCRSRPWPCVSYFWVAVTTIPNRNNLFWLMILVSLRLSPQGRHGGAPQFPQKWEVWRKAVKSPVDTESMERQETAKNNIHIRNYHSNDLLYAARSQPQPIRDQVFKSGVSGRHFILKPYQPMKREALPPIISSTFNVTVTEFSQSIFMSVCKI